MPTSKNGFSHAKEVYYIACFTIVLLITFYTLLGPEGYLEMKKRESTLREERLRVEELVTKNEDHQRTIELLKSNREAQEEHARKNGYARDNEIVVELPQDEGARKP